jgi:hypothetical protein
VIIAGQLVPLIGLVPTLQSYAAAIIAFAALAIVIQAARLRQDIALKPATASSAA